MKEITAIIRMNKVNESKDALAGIGICGLHAVKVKGRGKMSVDFKLLEEAGVGEELGGLLQDTLSHGGRLIPKRMLTILAHDNQVTEIINVLLKVNRHGNRGDGKIFVSPVTDVYRIRTGEAGDSAI